MHQPYLAFNLVRRVVAAGFLVTIALDLIIAGLLLSRLAMYGPTGVIETISTNFGAFKPEDLQSAFADFAIAIAVLLSLTALLALAERSFGQGAQLSGTKSVTTIGGPSVQPR